MVAINLKGPTPVFYIPCSFWNGKETLVITKVGKIRVAPFQENDGSTTKTSGDSRSNGRFFEKITSGTKQLSPDKVYTYLQANTSSSISNSPLGFPGR